ncbi:hypothetical protein ACH4MW_37445 [Streptomyces luteogriseus]|uniref:hypothetical protein n=1 Tax=Streptomyces luteogriseus TaxID=68233 RepID=UPI00379E665F
MLAEWLLVVAALPTTLVLWGGDLGWWRSTGIEYVAFGINTVKRWRRAGASAERTRSTRISRRTEDSTPF